MRRIGLAVGALAWAGLVVSGYVALARHAYTPAPVARLAVRWPSGSPLPAPSGRASLLVFAHPECPCTRATLVELARLVGDVGKRLSVHVLFAQPQEGAFDARDGGAWRLAVAVPDADVRLDVDGREARRFGAEASGQAALYDSSGRLVFEGGLTPARGHAGDSAGGDAIRAFVTGRGRLPDVGSSAVFGCALAVGGDDAR